MATPYVLWHSSWDRKLKTWTPSNNWLSWPLVWGRKEQSMGMLLWYHIQTDTCKPGQVLLLCKKQLSRCWLSFCQSAKPLSWQLGLENKTKRQLWMSLTLPCVQRTTPVSQWCDTSTPQNLLHYHAAGCMKIRCVAS